MPSAGCDKPAIIFKKEVFPHPFGPIISSISPGPNAKERLRKRKYPPFLRETRSRMIFKDSVLSKEKPLFTICNGQESR